MSLHIIPAVVTQDGQVSRFPGRFHGGFLLANSGGAATADVYDGAGTSGQHIGTFAAAVSALDRYTIEAGLDIGQGLYVDVGANVSLLVVYYSIEEEATRDPKQPEEEPAPPRSY